MSEPSFNAPLIDELAVMLISIFHDESGFDQLAPEWDELVRDSHANSIFMTHMWQTAWWRHLGEGELLILAVREENGVLAGLTPLFRIPHRGSEVLSTVGCVDVSDYLDWIIRQGTEKRVMAALLDALESELADEWRILDLCNVPEGSPTLELIPDLARERGWDVENLIDDVVPLFFLPASWEAYEQMLPGKARRELRRKLRRAGPYSGVDWYIVGPEHDLGHEIESFLELLGMSRPDKANFMDARNRAFFHAVGHAAHAEGYLQLAFLTMNGRRVATYMNFAYDNRIMVYNSGIDPAAYRISPGIVLMAHLIRHAIEEGRYEIFDFLRGDEAYKYQLGGSDTHVHRLKITKSL